MRTLRNLIFVEFRVGAPAFRDRAVAEGVGFREQKQKERDFFHNLGPRVLQLLDPSARQARIRSGTNKVRGLQP